MECNFNHPASAVRERQMNALGLDRRGPGHAAAMGFREMGIVDKPCKFEGKCKKDDCHFTHPQIGMIDKPCRHKGDCKFDDCKFSHPASALRESLFPGGPMGGRQMGMNGRGGGHMGMGGMGGGHMGMGGMGGGHMGMGGGQMGMGPGMGMGNEYYNEPEEDYEETPSIAYMKKMKDELESMMENVMAQRGGGRNGAPRGGGPIRDGRDSGRFDPMGRGSMGRGSMGRDPMGNGSFESMGMGRGGMMGMRGARRGRY